MPYHQTKGTKSEEDKEKIELMKSFLMANAGLAVPRMQEVRFSLIIISKIAIMLSWIYHEVF